MSKRMGFDDMTAKTALIIGASRGLGLGLAERFLERGWRVVCTTRAAGSRDLSALAERSNGRLALETVDIDDESQVAALHDRLRGTSFDLVFVSAGITHDRWE